MNTDITRYGTGPRMSEAVAYNGILWVAGQLGEPGGSVADQTRQALAAIDAILANDTPVIMAVTFVFACLVVLFNLIADILYGWLDPRISFN